MRPSSTCKPSSAPTTRSSTVSGWGAQAAGCYGFAQPDAGGRPPACERGRALRPDAPRANARDGRFPVFDCHSASAIAGSQDIGPTHAPLASRQPVASKNDSRAGVPRATSNNQSTCTCARVHSAARSARARQLRSASRGKCALLATVPIVAPPPLKLGHPGGDRSASSQTDK